MMGTCHLRSRAIPRASHNDIDRKWHKYCVGIGTCLLAFLLGWGTAQGNPRGGVVVSGTADIEATTTKRLDVRQHGNRVIIDWRSFDIARDEHTKFSQPSASSVALNRVSGGDATEILGRLSGNGILMLVNPQGIVFGPGARVDVAGLIAATADIGNEDFMAGHDRFTIPGARSAAVANFGDITVAEQGLVALVAPSVRNAGTIQARLGRVTLAAGDTFTLDLYGDRLVELAVDGARLDQITSDDAAVRNDGAIIADGGTVLLTARAANEALHGAINMDGLIQARSVAEQAGRISLRGGPEGIVRVRGRIDASGQESGTRGGRVEIRGQRVGLFGTAAIDVSGRAGGGQALIGGDFQGQGADQQARQAVIARDTVINADGGSAGDGGRIIVWSDEATRFDGQISARGGDISGDGGFVEVSGKDTLIFRGHVDATASNGAIGTLMLDPTDIVVEDAGAAAIGDIDDFADAGASVSISPASLDGAGASVVLQATQDITFTDSVALSTTGAGITAQAGRDITVNAAISTTGGAVTLIANDSATTQADGSIFLNAAIDTTTGGTAGGVIDLTVDGGTGGIDLGANLTTQNATIDLNGAVSVSAPLTLDSANGAISFANVVDGAQDFTVDAGTAATTFTGNVGGVTPIGDGTGAALTLLSSGATTFQETLATASGISGAGTVTFRQDVTLGNGDTASTFAGAMTLDGLTFTANDGAAFIGPVTLSNSAVTVQSANAAFAFNSTVDGAQDFTIDAGTAATTFTGNVGGGAPIGDGTGPALSLLSTGATTFQGTLATASGISGAGAVTFQQDVTLGNGDTASSFAGALTLDGLTFTANDGATFNGAVTLSGGAVTVQSANAAFAFNSTVNGAQDITVDAGTAATTFTGNVGGGTAIGDGTGATLSLLSTGATTFRGTLATASGISGTGAVTFQQDVTLGNGDTASTFAGAMTLDGLTFTADDGAAFNGAVTLSGGAVTVQSVNAAFAFNSIVNGAQDFTIDAGTAATTFTGNVGGGAPIGDGTGPALSLLSTGATTFQGTLATASGISGAGAVTFQQDVTLGNGDTASTFAGAMTLDGLTFTADDGAAFNGAVTLSGGAVTVQSTNAAFAFNSAVNGAQDFTVDAGTAATMFTGNVGGVTPIGDGTGAALTLLSSGATTFQGTLATASGISGTGAVTFRQDVTLGNGDTASAFAGALTLDGLIFTANDGATFNGAVTLSGGAVTVQSTNAALAFNSTVNGAQDFTVSAGTGAATFAADVGDDTPIGDGTSIALRLLSTGDTTFQGTLTTNGAMTALGPVFFTGDVALGGGGSTQFTGDVILVGTTLVSSHALDFFNDVILLGAAARVETSDDEISFSKNPQGFQNLAVDSGTAATTFSSPRTPKLIIGSGSGFSIDLLSSGQTRFTAELTTRSGIRAAGPVRFTGDSVSLGTGGASSQFNGPVTLAPARGFVFDAGNGAVFNDGIAFQTTSETVQFEATGGLQFGGSGLATATDSKVLIAIDGNLGGTINGNGAIDISANDITGTFVTGSGAIINAQGDFTGVVTAASDVTITAGGDIDLTVAAGDTAVETAGNISGAVNVADLFIDNRSAATLTGTVNGAGGSAAATQVALVGLAGSERGPFFINGVDILEFGNFVNTHTVRPPIVLQAQGTPQQTTQAYSRRGVIPGTGGSSNQSGGTTAITIGSELELAAQLGLTPEQAATLIALASAEDDSPGTRPNGGAGGGDGEVIVVASRSGNEVTQGGQQFSDDSTFLFEGDQSSIEEKFATGDQQNASVGPILAAASEAGFEETQAAAPEVSSIADENDATPATSDGSETEPNGLAKQQTDTSESGERSEEEERGDGDRENEDREAVEEEEPTQPTVRIATTYRAPIANDPGTPAPVDPLADLFQLVQPIGGAAQTFPGLGTFNTSPWATR